MTPTIRNLHDAYIHVVVRSFLKKNNLPCTSLFGYVPFYVSIDPTFWIEISRTGSTKQDYRAIDAMFLYGRFRSKCNANASGCDQIVPTRVTDAGASISEFIPNTLPPLPWTYSAFQAVESPA